MKQLSRPMSAACAERVFSYLSHMDASDRRTMKKETLKLLLFLCANHATLSELVEEESARRVMASKAGADERSRKRAREGKKAMDAVTAVAEEAAAKRKRETEEEEEEEQATRFACLFLKTFPGPTLASLNSNRCRSIHPPPARF